LRPGLARQPRAKALLGAFPGRPCLPQLGGAGLGEADQLLAPVLPGADRYPPGVDQGTEVARERRFVQRGQAAEVSLPNLARVAQVAEQRVLCNAQPNAAQLLVVEPADGPGCLPQGVAQARRSSHFRMFERHARCIYKQSAFVKRPLKDSPSYRPPQVTYAI